MSKTILITGSTDGLGFETARALITQGQTVLLHGRSAAKVKAAQVALPDAQGGYVADLSDPDQVHALARQVAADHPRIDVLINNAGVMAAPNPVTARGLDIRFAVNTLAPALLTQGLLPALGAQARVISLSSAAQAPVSLDALHGHAQVSEKEAYAQSKLALTMWSAHMAATHPQGPVFVAVNPGSFLGTRMVREGYGIPGGDVGIGVDILTRVAVSDEFATASGRYYDNDARRFTDPHPDALNPTRNAELAAAVDTLLAD
ncbi:hypothetical protein RUESEDTHA_04129 [Ruegeria sp. THAF57]|uniref:SDR family NAD(P)-dependent oxidoreductase n=1 Tax=Ruegeria sp. THAF57 TaxID=2744555 RepID=UPI0015DDAA61|nr:SDR family NAD(P)-dependent oxidoreductase [Ruegeria sp. THAF57]CAD0187217.1 hypothetical protein RUESEDTHA_04129 [Ruegeria sp. THAF57]